MSLVNVPTSTWQDKFCGLANKIQRQGVRYRTLSREFSDRAAAGTASVEYQAMAAQLEKCAQDMEYAFSKATSGLSPTEILMITTWKPKQ